MVHWLKLLCCLGVEQLRNNRFRTLLLRRNSRDISMCVFFRSPRVTRRCGDVTVGFLSKSNLAWNVISTSASFWPLPRKYKPRMSFPFFSVSSSQAIGDVFRYRFVYHSCQLLLRACVLSSHTKGITKGTMALYKFGFQRGRIETTNETWKRLA